MAFANLMHRTFVVKYPPQYDGELHIHTTVNPDTIGKTMNVSVSIRMLPHETEKETLQRLGMDMQRAK